MPTKCALCSNNVNPEKEITCDTCGICIHSTCSDLSRAEVQCVLAKDRHISFNCKTCKKKSTELTNLVTTIEALRKEIEVLKDQVSLNTQNNSRNIYEKEEIVNEIAERQRRATNIIVFGLPVSEADDVSQSKVNDNSKVTKVIGALASVPYDNVKAFRIGRPRTDNKPRPVKVVLKSVNEAISILKNKHKLRDHHLYNNLNIAADQTPMQREYLNTLRDELLKKGDPNLTIRYINNIPKIVPKSKN
ncbi:hypothetical protein RI129_000460 [Pyrocoelia pectoralis]|uniref:Phorbol-ester/DAG-type domain-containing protein n=1 Tax=Pyrocoelia pectoralis TaxID=417401 RepID=A0AAN7ZVX3_9COLE